MIKAINIAPKTIEFRAKSKGKNPVDFDEDETRLLPNTLGTRIDQIKQRTLSAFIDYPPKGLRGDVNSDFYEFLTMGIVPYLAGSAMFMGVFNCVNKFLDAKGQKIASATGKKLALGVIFYGIFKNLSEALVTKPVKAATGVDIAMPYQKKVYNLPKGAGSEAELDPVFQQATVYDSKEFFRKDLLDREYFDNVAKKVGLGENLNDSISETTPIIHNIVSTTKTARSLSSYSWAAVGVALASQDAWVDFFDSISNRKRYISKDGEALGTKLVNKSINVLKNTVEISKMFIKSLGRSCRQLWNGKPSYTGFMKHAGKGLVATTIALTIGLTSNAIIRARKMASKQNQKTIDNSKGTMVI